MGGSLAGRLKSGGRHQVPRSKVLENPVCGQFSQVACVSPTVVFQVS